MKRPDINNLTETEIEIKELGKKITVKTDGSPRSLIATFNFVSGLIARNELRDTSVGLNPPKPTHEIVGDEDGRYTIKRLRF